jgi:hypothetical protein
VEQESQNVLGPALQGQIDLLRSKGFSPTRVYVDSQSALKTLTMKFENVCVDMGGASDFVPKVDAKIRRIKGREIRSEVEPTKNDGERPGSLCGLQDKQ